MRIVLILAALAVATPVITPPAEAGVITRACMTSDRKAKTYRLCRCIQSAADQTLSRSDQRLASSFFQDPHRAQEIRQSDRNSHERFWQRYKRFGSVAEQYCG